MSKSDAGNETRLSPRAGKPASAGSVILIAVVASLSGLVLIGMGLAAPSNSSAGPVFLGLGVWLAGAVWVLKLVARLLLSHRWISLAVALAGVSIIVAATQAFILPVFRRANCGAWMIMDGSTLRQIGQAGASELAEHGELPATFAMEMVDPAKLYDNRIWSWCAPKELREIRVGRFDLQDVRSGRVSLAEFESEARRVDAGPGSWERLGRFVFSRDPAGWRLPYSNLVVAYSYCCAPDVGTGLNVMFADGHLEYCYPNQSGENETCKSAIAVATSCGHCLPPDDFFDALQPRKAK